MKFKWLDGLLIAGLGMIATGIGINYRGQGQESKVEVVRNEVGGTGDIQRDSRVMIDIEGEVIRPGVYEMAEGSRVNDVLVIAGGLAAGADREWVELNINRAQIVIDGMKIYIPKVGAQSIAPVLGEKSGLISINSAGVEELDKLSGIGPALARRIIDYRVENGGFKDINELKLVSGIGDKLFDKIKDEIAL